MLFLPEYSPILINKNTNIRGETRNFAFKQYELYTYDCKRKNRQPSCRTASA